MVKNFMGLSKKFNIDFCALLLILLCVNIPLSQKFMLPLRDSMNTFGMFYYFYNEYFFHGTIAQWSPFNVYGMPAHYTQLVSLTPASYLFLFLGKLFQIKNVMLLFKVSMLFEQLVFLMGMYFLSRTLYRRRITIFIICVSAIACNVWLSQIYFNFRIYYTFPLISYFIILFFSKKSPGHLCCAIIIGIISTLGVLPYFALLWIFLFFILFLSLYYQYRVPTNKLFKLSASNVVGFSLTVLLALAFFFFFKNITHFVSISAPNRLPGGGTDLKTFLTYGGNPDLFEVLKSFLFAKPLYLSTGAWLDNTVYLGLLPFIFFFWALFKVRGKKHIAFLTVLFVLVCFSLGGMTAALIYKLPGMSYYRHVGLVFGLLKIIVLICAGFGLDQFLSLHFRKRKKYLFYSLALLIILVETSEMLQGSMIEGSGIWAGVRLTHFEFRLWAYIVPLTLFFIVSLFNKFWSRSASKEKKILLVFEIVLVLALFVDLFSFRLSIYKEIPKLEASYYDTLEAFDVHPVSFQEERVMKPFSRRQKLALKMLERPGGGFGKNSYVHDFLQFDSCLIPYRGDFMSTNVAKVFELNPVILSILSSCEEKKLRLTTNIEMYASEDEMFDNLSKLNIMMNSIVGLDNAKVPEAVNKVKDALGGRVYLLNEADEVLSNFKSKIFYGANSLGELTVEQFRADEIIIQANVTEKEGSWLFYADAYHPGWHAQVDGVKSKIYQAFLVHKAVFLEQGNHLVRLYFHQGLNSIISQCMFYIGIVFSTFIFLAGAITLFSNRNID